MHPILTWRPAEVDDAVAISGLITAVGEAEGLPERMSPETVRHELTAPHVDLDSMTRMGLDAAGRPLALAWIWFRPSEEVEQRAYVQVNVHPEVAGGGIEEELTDWVVDRATELLRSVDGDLPAYVCRFALDFQEDDIARFTARGLEVVRYFWDMERPLDPAESPPAAPEGIAIEPWHTGFDAAVRLVHNDAFADHWGSRPISAETWEHDMMGSPGFRRDLSFVALAGDAVVGYSFNEVYEEDWEAAGRPEGWIGGLGVLREYRKRGIASALMRRSFVAMAGAGIEAAMIGVDSANPSGAHHLYASIGFTTKYRAITLQKRVN